MRNKKENGGTRKGGELYVDVSKCRCLIINRSLDSIEEHYHTAFYTRTTN